MIRNKYQLMTGLSGVFCGLVFLGFSDTARAQSVTLSGATVTNNTINFTVQHGSVSAAQVVHVSTSSDPSTVNVQVGASSPWIHITEASTGQNNLSTPVDLHITVDATNLTQGTQPAGTITVTMPAFPSAKQILTVNVTVNGTSLLSSNPPSLSFTTPVGADPATIPTQQLTISSSGAQLNYTVTTTTVDGNPWLIPFNSTGTTGSASTDMITVGVNPARLGVGPYQGTITVQSTTTSDSVAINVMLTVTPNTTLSVTPSTLPPFLYQIGTTPVSGQLTQTLQVSSTNTSANFQVSMSPSVPWLVIQPSSGATGTGGQAAAVTLTVNPQGLGASVYNTTVTVSLLGGGSPTPVPVQLIVSSNPLLSLSKNSLTFTSSFNASTPPPSQAVQVGTVGNQSTPVGFTVTSDSSWLTWTVPGSATPGTINVSVNPSALAVNNYTGHLTVTPNNSDASLYSLTITVNFNVGNAAQVTAGPALLVFSWQTTQAPPVSQLVELFTAGQPSTFSLATSTTTASNCPSGWLGANTTSVNTQNAIVTVSVNTTGMTPGVCPGTVTVTYPAGSPTAQTLQIPVTVNVSNSALLNISMPQGFGVVTAAQGSGQVTQSITLTSTDPATPITDISSSASSNGPATWLFTGQSGRSTAQTLEAVIQPGSLPPNTYGGSILISSASLPSSPVTIPVQLTVTSNVTVTVSPATVPFTQSFGGPVPTAQQVTLTPSGNGATFQTSIPSTAACSWLQVSPTSGPASGPVTFSVLQNSLPQNANPYSCTVTFSFLNSATISAQVTATLTVGPSLTLTVPSTPLTFTYQVGGAAPASQQLTLTSAGGAVNYTASASSNGGWLGIDSTSGTTGSSGSKVINVSVDPTKFPAGTAAGASLPGSIVISASGVLANPVTVNVTVNVVAAAAPAPTFITNSTQPATGFGAIAAGEIITIRGTNLGPATCAPPAACAFGGYTFTVNADGTINSKLGGVQVLFDTIPGTPIFVSATQINVVVPWEIAGRALTNMIVAYNGTESPPLQLNVAAVAPGIYTQDATGSGQAAVVNFSSNAASVYNGPAGGTYFGTTLATAPAPQGSEVIFYLTGGGLTNPVGVDGTLTPATAVPLKNWTLGSSIVTATVGGQPATVLYAGAAPTLITGAVQINLQLPTGVTGNQVQVVITIDGVQSQTVTIAIQ